MNSTLELSKRQLNKFKNIFETDIPKVFLIVAFTFGMLIIFLTPPLQGPDETAHFLRTVQISRLDATVDQHDSQFGGFLNGAYGEFIQKVFNEPDISFHPERTIKPGLIKASNGIELKGHDSEFLTFGTTATTTPVPYLPASLGASIASAVGFGPLGIFYFARIFSFLSWLALTYFAIKIIPIHKLSLAVVNLIPMLVFQVGMITADTMAFALVSLLVANVLRLRFKTTPLSKMDWLGISSIIFVLTLTKPVMFVFSPLIFLIGNKANNKRTRLFQFLVCTVAVPLSQVWAQWTTSRLGKGVVESAAADSAAQQHFLIHSPQTVINLVYNTYFTTSGDHIFVGLFGNFGWVDTPLPIWIICICALVVMLSFFVKPSEQEKAEIIEYSIFEKGLLALIAIGYFLAANIALYLYYTPPKWPTFYGVQGRYFLPILILATIFIVKKPSKRFFARFTQAQIFGAMIALLAFSSFAISARYYV